MPERLEKINDKNTSDFCQCIQQQKGTPLYTQNSAIYLRYWEHASRKSNKQKLKGELIPVGHSKQLQCSAATQNAQSSPFWWPSNSGPFKELTMTAFAWARQTVAKVKKTFCVQVRRRNRLHSAKTLKFRKRWKAARNPQIVRRHVRQEARELKDKGACLWRESIMQIQHGTSVFLSQFQICSRLLPLLLCFCIVSYLQDSFIIADNFELFPIG